MAVGGEDRETIGRFPLFQGLAPDIVSSVVRGAEIRDCAKRTAIFEQGQPVTHFFGVLCGWVKLFRLRPDGSEVIIEVFGPGESFAEGAICMEGGYPVSGEMVEDGRLPSPCRSRTILSGCGKTRSWLSGPSPRSR